VSDVHLALVDDPVATVERDLDGTLLEATAPTVTPDVVRGGRRFTAAAVARRPGLVLSVIWLGLVTIAALRPTLLTSRDPLGVEGAARLQSPSWSHLFGTDQLGRDLYSRVVHGAALSMKAALLAVVVGLVVGSLIGLVSGFVRGWVDDAIMRLVDVILSIPALLLALALITVLGFGTYNVALAVGLASIAACARVMRSEVMRVSQSPFVEAAGANGARWSSVLLRHVLPNSLGPVIVLAALEFGTAILAIASLSFLGYGAQPPTPEWGSLVSTGRDFLREAWWLTTMPGLTVAASVLAANRIARALDAGRGRS
jgi:peptide/nickel transport system permease protein